MSSLRSIVLGCVSTRSRDAAASETAATAKRFDKVKFGVPLAEALKSDSVPQPLVDLLVYIAQEGVTTTDLFRRPGNPTDLKNIIKCMAEGREIIWTDYNFYTLASVVKKFLLKIPEGIFGKELEEQLLSVLDLNNRMEQYDLVHRVITSLPVATQRLIALVFGTWFRVAAHAECNAMTSEAVARSVAGSVLHTCASEPAAAARAAKLLRLLVDDFGVAALFGRANVRYFAAVTQTGISVREKFRYEFRYPTTMTAKTSGDDAADDDGVTASCETGTPSEKPLQLFARILQNEARKRGFNIDKNAISEEEFYEGRRRADTTDSQQSAVEIHLPTSPPSPLSLQPQLDVSADSFTTTHKPLTQMSSLSAPEVNQVCSASPTRSPNTTYHYMSTSLNRVDTVRRRQMLRLRKRSDWFLGPSSSVETESALGGSQEDALSAGSLASLDEAPDTVQNGRHAPATPLHRTEHRPLQRLCAGIASRSSDRPPLDCSGYVSGSEVRYFMVQNEYGATQTEDEPS